MSLDIDLIDPTATYGGRLYNANITHNLGAMAKAAGIYEALWRPYLLKTEECLIFANYDAECSFEEKTTTIAKDLIPLVEAGLAKLKSAPDYYKQFNSPNGWGVYKHFVPFVEDYFEALREFPNAIVKVDR